MGFRNIQEKLENNNSALFYFSDWPSNQLTKTEALSGSQHVVLWLTRTSMSDMPSVPSLKNLVQSSLFGENSNNGGRSGQRSSNSVKPYGKNSSNHNGNPIQRNFSTKSFLKLHKGQEISEGNCSLLIFCKINNKKDP